MKRISIILLVISAAFSSCKKDKELSYSAQLAHDITVIDEYLADNNITAITDTSGLRYVIKKQGSGKIPTLQDTVALQITARLLNNSVVSSDTTGALYAINQLIFGLQVGLLKMPKGSTYVFYMPSGIAYGQSGSNTGSVAPNTNVIFEVTLLDDDAELVKEKAYIDNYLKDADVQFVKDSTGLRYIVESAGTGNFPTASSTLTINYVGTILTSGKQFDTGSLFVFSESDTQIIFGLRHGLTHIQAGGKIKIFIPSKLAYGFNGTSDNVIPRNAILVFDVSLVSIQ